MPLPRFQATPDGTASPEMQAAYARDGFLVIEGFKSAQECDALRQRSHDLVEAFDPQTVTSIFEAGGDQRHAADRYFQESGDTIRFFFEKGAFDERGRLAKDKHAALNKIGHALHDLDPVFDRFSRDPKLANLARSLGLRDPGLVQSMVILKPPSSAARSAAIRTRVSSIRSRFRSRASGSRSRTPMRPTGACSASRAFTGRACASASTTRATRS